jgi:hypothetical protein
MVTLSDSVRVLREALDLTAPLSCLSEGAENRYVLTSTEAYRED